MAKKEEKPTTVKCRAITKAWASRRPGAPRKLIDDGEEVEWPVKKDKDGKLVLPSWLKPLGDIKPPKPTAPEPRTMSEVQGHHSARRPTGA